MRVLAWALYDLANTFFAVAMLTFYFPIWVIEEQGARELSYSIAVGVSMACVALIMPLCGALSDVTGERMRFLKWTTYGCAAATFLIGFAGDVRIGLGLFVLANICYQLGTVFYDALLWQVSSPGRLGSLWTVWKTFTLPMSGSTGSPSSTKRASSSGCGARRGTVRGSLRALRA